MFIIALLSSAFADPGDTCSQAKPMLADSTVTGNTINRLPDGAPVCGAANENGGVWFEFVAPADGVLILDACASTVIPRIAVYTDSCGALTCVDGIDDSCSGSPLEVDVEDGVTYTILAHKELGMTGGVFALTNAFVEDAPTVEPNMDCTGRIPVVCQLVNRMVKLVNTEAGSLVFTEGASSSRLRPSKLYNRIKPIQQTSSGASCTILGTMGGLYDGTAGTWQGSDFQAFVGANPANGTLEFATQSYEGTTGLFAPYGNRFGLYNRRGQLASSGGASDDLYVMGRWTRISGTQGVYTNVVGSCSSTDYAGVFDSWYFGGLPFVIQG